MLHSPNLTCAETQPASPLREGEANYGDLECCTPTSKESRLPLVPLNCPPAPRKRRMETVVMSLRKRRRLQLDDQVELITVGAADLEQLFQLRDDAMQTHAKRNWKKKKQRNDSKHE